MTEEIHPRTRAQLEALDLDPARPLLAVDADEVLVVFAAHLAEFVARSGHEMRLTEYRLEGAIRHRATGEAVSFERAIAFIEAYFAEEAGRQDEIPGAAAALARLSERAQVVVLTNVPHRARDARVARLSELGMPYPVVENSGGKGPAFAWMAARTAAPHAFVDDSPGQIASVAAAAPGAALIHFTGAPMVCEVAPDCAEATARVADWAAAEAALAAHFG